MKWIMNVIKGVVENVERCVIDNDLFSMRITELIIALIIVVLLGIFVTILYNIYKKFNDIYKKIKNIYKKSKNNRHKCDKTEKSDIFEQWEKSWKSGKSEFDEEVEKFSFEFIKSVYQTTSEKAEKNESKNFQVKKCLLIVVMIEAFIYFLFFVVAFLGKVGIGENILLLAAFSLVYWAFEKWIRVKKYQETWVRHSVHLLRLKSEMISFIWRVPPYDQMCLLDRKQRFLERFVELEKENADKFAGNMANEEKLERKSFQFLNKEN